ncbi:hypothetical protein COB21_02540 [Candidatus Aerophobetes bacterium]|uniref:MOMP-like family protein n=1 Tax=Aerophobetes bacterium TaxID=2030807 RepID=A0A2A4X5J9_UNCAE|nr:MAG: hypothetical protein COB21_02540 [Candidatus Aerophobetes bacterium]
MRRLNYLPALLAAVILTTTPQNSFAFSLSKLLGASSLKSQDASPDKRNTSGYGTKKSDANTHSFSDHPWHFQLSGDYLYWKATQEGLSFALKGCRNVPGTTIDSTGTDFSPDFSWNSGFKVAASALYNPRWDTTLRYTRYTSNNNQASCSDPDGNIQEGFILGTLIASNNFQSQCTFASSNWDLNFNTLDLEVGRHLVNTYALKMRACAGLKFAYQTQNWNNFFHVNQMYFDQNSDSMGPGKVSSNQQHKTLGTGIRIGGRADWMIVDHVSLFSSLALSALWTHYDVSRKDVFTLDSDNIPVTAVDVRRNSNSSNTIRAISEFDLGINTFWDLPRNQSLDLSLAYEMQIWINNSSYIFIINDANSSLSLQGLNLRVRYGF